MDKYEFITKVATEVDSKWSNKQVAQFHTWNPNGLVARKRALNVAIDQAITDGRAKSGAFWVHGTGNMHAVHWMYDFCKMSKFSVKARPLGYSLHRLRQDIENGEEFLRTLNEQG